MLNTQGYSKLPNVPIIIKNNPTQTVQGQGMMLQLNPSANGTFLLNSQGQPLKVQGNILTQVFNNKIYNLFFLMKIIFLLRVIPIFSVLIKALPHLKHKQ